MKHRILCYGDSNTHGYYLRDEDHLEDRFNENQRWTCLLQKQLGEDYRIIEEGLSGRTTVFEDPVEEGLNGLTYITPCLKTHKPLDLAIVMLGTNDTKERFHVSAANIARGMQRLLQKMVDYSKAWRTHPRILLISPVPLNPAYIKTKGAPDMGRGCAEKSQELAAEYQKVAEEFSCYFLDASKIPGISLNPADWVHLTEESHRLFANVLEAKIREIFTQNC